MIIAWMVQCLFEVGGMNGKPSIDVGESSDTTYLYNVFFDQSWAGLRFAN